MPLTPEEALALIEEIAADTATERTLFDAFTGDVEGDAVMDLIFRIAHAHRHGECYEEHADWREESERLAKGDSQPES